MFLALVNLGKIQWEDKANMKIISPQQGFNSVGGLS